MIMEELGDEECLLLFLRRFDCYFTMHSVLQRENKGGGGIVASSVKHALASNHCMNVEELYVRRAHVVAASSKTSCKDT